MRTNIFYSWQSDLENKYNRFFVQDCLKKAIKELSKDSDIHVEWNIDRDTKGEFGTVDIVETIFKKINESHIFIGDISLINEGSKKKTPNPNVLVELGYAATKVGWENVITIFNEAHGKVEELPFDLRFRRPIIYKLDANTDKEKVAQIKKDLIRVIKETILKANPEYVLQMRKLELEFSQETKEALRLAIDKPNLWMQRLIQEILRANLEKIENMEFEIREGLYLKEIKLMEFGEFVNWGQKLYKSIGNMMEVLDKTLNFEFRNSFIPDDIESSIMVRRCITRACSICYRAFQLEKELLSIEPPEKALSLKKYLLGHSEIFTAPIKKLYKDVTKIIDKKTNNEIGETPVISITVSGHPNQDLIDRELKRLTQMSRLGYD